MPCNGRCEKCLKFSLFFSLSRFRSLVLGCTCANDVLSPSTFQIADVVLNSAKREWNVWMFSRSILRILTEAIIYIYWPNAVGLMRSFLPNGQGNSENTCAPNVDNIVINTFCRWFSSFDLVGKICITKQQFKYVSCLLKHIKLRFLNANDISLCSHRKNHTS